MVHCLLSVRTQCHARRIIESCGSFRWHTTPTHCLLSSYCFGRGAPRGAPSSCACACACACAYAYAWEALRELGSDMPTTWPPRLRDRQGLDLLRAASRLFRVARDVREEHFDEEDGIGFVAHARSVAQFLVKGL